MDDMSEKVAKITRILLRSWGQSDLKSKPLVGRYVWALLALAERTGLRVSHVSALLDGAGDGVSALLDLYTTREPIDRIKYLPPDGDVVGSFNPLPWAYDSEHEDDEDGDASDDRCLGFGAD